MVTILVTDFKSLPNFDYITFENMDLISITCA